MVPPQTPLTLFVGICLVVILLLNVIFFAIPRIMNRLQAPGPKSSTKRRYHSYLLMAIVWVYLLISSPMSRAIALVMLATMIVGSLAVWIANKIAGSIK